MNLIPKLMEALELKEGERFKVKIQGRATDVEYWFTDSELWFDEPGKLDTNLVERASTQTISSIVRGEYEVIKLPWVPKIGDYYWCVKPSSNPDYPQTTLVTMNYSVFSLFNLIFGNYFQTQDQAEEHKNNFIDHIKSYTKLQPKKGN